MLASSEAKDPLPKTSIEDSDKRLAGVLKPGNFPLQYYNRRAPKQALGADWSGRERTLVRKRFTRLYIAAERNFSLFGYLNL